MGQITKAFAEDLLQRAHDLKHSPLTCHEQAQLAEAWLLLHAQSSEIREPDMLLVPRRFLTDFLDGLEFHNGHGTPSFDRVMAHALYSEAISRLGSESPKKEPQ